MIKNGLGSVALALVFSVFTSTVSEAAEDNSAKIVIKPYVMNTNTHVERLPNASAYNASSVGAALGLAYEPAPWVGVELRRSFREDIDLFFDWDERLDVSTWDASVYFQSHLNKVIFLRLKAGISDWDAEAFDDDVNTSELESEAARQQLEPWNYREKSNGVYFAAEGQDFFGAVGVGFNIRPGSNITLDYEILETNAFRFETVLLGFGFKI